MFQSSFRGEPNSETFIIERDCLFCFRRVIAAKPLGGRLRGRHDRFQLCAELPIPIVILHRPLHLARERSDATLRLRRGLRKTTSHKRRNGKWRKYHKARLWQITPDRPIRSSRIVSDSPVAAWFPPNEKYARVEH